MMRYAAVSMESDPTRQALLAALDATGELVLPLQGGSMGARWARAEAVVVRSVARRPPAWGDAVVFSRQGRWYAHRLILRIGARCWTKGDARWAWDRPVPRADEIAGVVVGLVVRGARVPLTSARAASVWQLARALVAWPLLGRRVRAT